MRRLWHGGAAFGAILGLLSPAPSEAWDRGDVDNFATIPAFSPSGPGASCPNGAKSCTSDIEGVAVRPMVRSIRRLSASTATARSADMASCSFSRRTASCALTFDKSGNVYVSDSFQGVIWKTGVGGGTPTAWYSPTNPGQNDLLLPDANVGEILIPPFGANGIEFNNEGTALFAMNTAYHSIVKIPVKSDGSAGTGVTFTTGLNAPDGLAVDASDNLWIAANQGDEIVVVDPSGMVIAKKGDFDGITDEGSIRGLLFPASVAFSPDKRRLYVTNLALYLPFAGVPAIAVDSGWTLPVKHYNIAVIDVSPRR
jgi:DNA-binding beta-propeller fold protein YncE